MAAYDAALAAPDEHLSDKSADMSDDEGWAQIAGEYSEARRRESEAKAEADALRDQLIERAKATGCKNATGYGWQVIRREQIGRASSRARGCQVIEISVGAVYCNKNK